jgi:hypothetical protein
LLSQSKLGTPQRLNLTRLCHFVFVVMVLGPTLGGHPVLSSQLRNPWGWPLKCWFTISKFLCMITVGNSKFWRICKKCLRELNHCLTLSQFPTYPSKLRIYLCKIPTVITETLIV